MQPPNPAIHQENCLTHAMLWSLHDVNFADINASHNSCYNHLFFSLSMQICISMQTKFEIKISEYLMQSILKPAYLVAY
jgi:hypothetical protein